MDIYKNINEGKYRNEVGYRTISEFTCSCGVKYQVRSKTITKHCSECGKEIQSIILQIRENNAKINDDYIKENQRLEEMFKSDLFAYHNVTDNPKKDQAYSLAYDRGHSSGYSEIALEFDDLVGLIK